MGSSFHARLFWPEPTGDTAAGIPAVVVSPGYLANGRYMNVPWAADITEMGAAALMVDRRGQGRSDGSLWPREPQGTGIGDSEPALLAALAHLRSLAPEIDPDRIALLGHSDGATAALIAGSTDWEVRSTIAVSPSTGPWQYVNHVAPQNMLLIFGADDRFILDDTDTALISRATRFELADEGSLGDPRIGDARRLVRVPGTGHLDVLVSATARAEVRRWLSDTLALPRGPEPAPGHGSRMHWLTLGVVSLGAVLSYRPGAVLPPTRRRSDKRHLLVLISVGVTWAAGLVVFSAPLERHLRPVLPGQETAVFVASIWAAAGAVAVAALAVLAFRGPARRVAAEPIRTRQFPSAVFRGLGTAAAVILALKLLLLHHYEVTLTMSRGIVLLVLAAFLLPGFLALVGSLRTIASGTDRENRERESLLSGLLAVGAVITALLTPWLFTRMSMAGGYLTAAGLAATAAHHSGLAAGRLAESVTFASALVAALAAMACALY